MKNLSTQIATTREQSERLLSMGVKPETADMVYHHSNSKVKHLEWELKPCAPTLRSNCSMNISKLACPLYKRPDGTQMTGEEVFDSIWGKDIPAWSLSRLISMLPTSVPDPKPGFKPHHPELIKHESGYNLSIRRYTADCLVGTHIEKDPIGCCVSMIDWLIKNNHFNKEYLKWKRR